jgi:hypothetical protein
MHHIESDQAAHRRRSTRRTRYPGGARAIRRLASLLLSVAGCATVARAQAPADAGPQHIPFSIGQPTLWPQEAAVVAPLHGDGAGAPILSYGVHHALINPVLGLIGITAEGYAAVDRGAPIGIRGFAASPSLALSAGLDWDLRHGVLDPIVSYKTAIRRGGLLGHGTMLRVDWLPTRGQSFAVGLSVPMFEPLAGRTRPLHTHVSFGRVADENTAADKARSPMQPSAESHQPLPAAARSALAALDSAAIVLGAYTNAYSRDGERRIASAPGSYAAELARYAGALDRLFQSAGADPAAAARIVRRGRTAVLDDILFPVDSLFGQAKEDSRNIAPLTRAAAAAMHRWLADSSGLAPALQPPVAAAFDAWTAVIEHVNRRLADDADDPRLVWLPLELALTPEQFDEQSEVDTLIARAVGHPFTDDNALTYLRSTDLPLEIARSIYAARDYHVLWTHDFTGRRESGAIDDVGFSMVADAYFPALIAAVRRYDSTGVFPAYIILQDEFFYEPRDNRLWMNILQDPLHARIHLPGDTTDREARLRVRQNELRAAVAASPRLQRDAKATGDADGWLRRLIAVHVNIVEPRDFSFRSSHSIPGVPFTPDNIMRDHRKIVFYDLNEANPYRGAMLLMGVGIGEHYASATWEDRGYRLRGPATLEVRAALREALRQTGFTESQIPAPLRAVASTLTAEREMNIGSQVGRALQVHNEVGFGRKSSSVARAMLYNLAPPGSDIIVPDPLWLSSAWGGMLAGAAARGCRVYIIAPAVANAPNLQAPVLALEHDLLARMLALRQSLGARMRESGGELRVGLFAAHAQTDDAPGRAREVRAGLARAPWIRSLIPFDSATLTVLARAESEAASGEDATRLAHDEKPRQPQLHQKSQLIARPGAITALVQQPGWDRILEQSIRAQSRATTRFTEALGELNPNIDSAATRAADALLRGYEERVPERERRRVSFYFSLGTQNQDDRGIVSDGEAAVIVSGFQASVGVVDLYYLMARSTWVENTAQLEQFVPRPSALISRIARWLRATM